ncbi:outer membrane protein [Sphingomonas colocasiae]|uniref:Outer membrane beta-barrel protein n=1 Tax=Sphingomonas colocasiae TaxID=1848973 RepID=A0ABS7PPU5_9SPHN|nr:outer membrane beta-barrel protein [Sphingomonas colocasiae]MBY8823216.1 outer membrane beta-barrel protein [Sphingomonas colocasiae]
MKSMIIATAVLAALAAAPAAHAEGLRAELRTGYDNVSAAGESSDGVAYGFAIGYDGNVGDKSFLGFEAGYDDSTTRECVRNVAVAGDRTCIGAGRDLSVIARAGYRLTEKSSLYLLTGYTNARVLASYRSGTTRTKSGDNLDGFRVGAGYQLGISDKIYGKVEYRYSNYEADFSRHQGMVGLGVKF